MYVVRDLDLCDFATFLAVTLTDVTDGSSLTVTGATR